MKKDITTEMCKPKKKGITFAFVSNGGLTNLLINMNFIQAFCRKFKTKDWQVILFGLKDQTVNKALLKNQKYIDKYLPRGAFERADDYDLCIYLRFYPEVLYESEAARKNRKLHRQLESWRKFRNDIATRKFFDVYPEYDFNIYIYSMLNGKMCLDIRDIDHTLGLGKDYDVDLALDEGEMSLALKQLDLRPGGYITVHTGKAPHRCTAAPTRLWKPENYESLTGLLKKEYPHMKIVQVGTKENPALKGTDLNLAGRQSFLKFSAVMKHAAVHIGSDGGAVHLRKALRGGPSVVLFGPTPAGFYGYDNNINIQKKACPHWCAGLTDTWRNQCLAGETPACMESIGVREVFAAVKGILES